MLLNPKTIKYNGGPPGFGDFIKGTISFYSLRNEFNYDMYVNFSKHPISKYLINTIPPHIKIEGNTIECFEEYLINDRMNAITSILQQYYSSHTYGIFVTNMNIYKNIRLNNDDLINLQNYFKPNQLLLNELEDIKFNLQLYDNYAVVHIRSGDKNINNKLNHDLLKKFENKIDNINIKENNVVCLSDSTEIRNMLVEKYNFKNINSNVIHLGSLQSNNMDDAIKSTLIDFFILCGSSKIYSISVYDWFSGFSESASILYNIPIEKHMV